MDNVNNKKTPKEEYLGEKRKKIKQRQQNKGGGGLTVVWSSP